MIDATPQPAEHLNGSRIGTADERSLTDTTSPEPKTRAVEALLHHELRFETRVTYRNESMDPVLAALVGRTVVFASDFYMPGDFIHRLLSLNGVDCNFARTYASCEDGRSKRSGRMFLALADDLGVDRTEIVHVGEHARLLHGVHGVVVEAQRHRLLFTAQHLPRRVVESDHPAPPREPRHFAPAARHRPTTATPAAARTISSHRAAEGTRSPARAARAADEDQDGWRGA